MAIAWCFERHYRCGYIFSDKRTACNLFLDARAGSQQWTFQHWLLLSSSFPQVKF